MKNLLYFAAFAGSLILNGCNNEKKDKKLTENFFIGEVTTEFTKYRLEEMMGQDYVEEFSEKHHYRVLEDNLWDREFFSTNKDLFDKGDEVKIKYISGGNLFQTIESCEILKTAEEKRKEHRMEIYENFNSAIFENGKLVAGHLKQGLGVRE